MGNSLAVANLVERLRQAILDGSGVSREQWPAGTAPDVILAWVGETIDAAQALHPESAAQITLFVGQPQVVLFEEVIDGAEGWAGARGRAGRLLSKAGASPISAVVVSYGDALNAVLGVDAA